MTREIKKYDKVTFDELTSINIGESRIYRFRDELERSSACSLAYVLPKRHPRKGLERYSCERLPVDKEKGIWPLRITAVAE